MAPVKTSGIVYYTVGVSDMDRSVKWYGEKLGFRVTSKRGSNQSQKVVFITNQVMTLKLVKPFKAKSLPSGRSNPGTDNPVRGNKHFSFQVVDGPQAEKEIRALKIPVVMVPVVGDSYGIFICDPTGNLMEILQEEKPKTRAVPGVKLGSSPVAVTKWSHIGVSVANTEDSIKWYSEVLGYTFKHGGEIVTPDGRKLKITWLAAPNFCLEIFEIPGSVPIPPDRLNPFTDLKILGNKFPALGVSDMKKTAAELKKLGVGIVKRNQRNIFIRDRDGILIELVQDAK